MNGTGLQYADIAPASAIFVDMPNVIMGGEQQIRKVIVWRALMKAILNNNDLSGTDVRHAAVYSRNKFEANEAVMSFKRVLETYQEKAYVQAAVQEAKDTDSLTISDMWESVIEYQQSLIARSGRLQFPLQVRHILVSGDGGYLRAYQGLSRVYGECLQRELIIYSWRASLNRRLARVANKVYFLDDIPGLVRNNEPAI